MFIGGSWRQASDGRTIDVLNPATEKVVASVPNATDADLDDALASAAAGFEVWRRSLPGVRAEVFDRAARLVLDRADAAGAGLDVGMIGVNEVALASAASPFGGVKASGYGREGGTESLEAYTVATAVTTKGAP